MEVFRNKSFRIQMQICVSVLLLSGGMAYYLDDLAGVAVWGTGMAYCLIFLLFGKKRYREVRELSQQLDEILHMGNGFELQHFQEGDIEILRDELQKMILRLGEQTELLQQDKTALADALADISHQIRTPLTTLNLLVERLKKECLTERERQKLLREEGQMLERIQWLVTALLRLSKLDAGAIVLQHQQIFLHSFFQEAFEPFEVAMEVHEQTYEVHGSQEVQIIGDYNWTMEAIGNVLKNSLEYTPEGGKLLIQWNENPLYTEILITDSGKGIPEEDLPHLFERFYRGKNAGSNSFGIGLALSRAILAKENAVIYGANTESMGAQFTIRFYKTTV